MSLQHEILHFDAWNGERVLQVGAAGRIVLVRRAIDPHALQAVADDTEVQASVRTEAARCARLIREGLQAVADGKGDAWLRRRALIPRPGVRMAVEAALAEAGDEDYPGLAGELL